jgi:predicted  nucleic acid-binding Zn-ribbon protein
MTDTNPLNDLPEQPDLTLKEIIAIRKELEHLQNRGLANIWEQIKDLNEQNVALLKEVSLLRKNLVEQVAKGFIVASIVLSLIVGLLTMCAAYL